MTHHGRNRDASPPGASDEVSGGEARETRAAMRPSAAVRLLQDLPDPTGKRVLVRATLDRPMSPDPSEPLAYVRARGLASTVVWLTERGARVTVCGDTGAPGPTEERARIERVRRSLEGLISPGPLPEGTIVVRCCPEDPTSVEHLVHEHDLFVNDTLQDSSLPLPSLTIPPDLLPSAAGRTLEHDLEILNPLLVAPDRPFVAVLGGARSYDRLHGLESLLLRADTVLLGGAMALPVLQAVGRQPGGEEADQFLEECRHVVGVAGRVHHQVVAPPDLVWRRSDGSTVITPSDVRGGEEVVDIGPVTRVRYAEFVQGAGVTLWAGAMGQVEDAASAVGTRELATSFHVGSRVILGGDALVRTLYASGALPPGAEVLSATDAAIELLKWGDLPALSALRHHSVAAPPRRGTTSA